MKFIPILIVLLSIISCKEKNAEVQTDPKEVTETVTESPVAVTASAAVDNHASCGGLCDGQATVTPGGGIVAVAYQYSWTGGQTTAVATALCAGPYTVTVTDDNGCSATSSITVTEANL